MFEAHGKTYETKAEAIREAKVVANASRESIYVWETETGMPCAFVVADIRMREAQ